MSEANNNKASSVRKCKRTVGASSHSSPYYAVWKTWKKLKGRCHTPTDSWYKNYGARGIVVCDGWRYDFSAFRDDMGSKPTPEHSIDRINNDGNYSCGKCDHCKENGWPSNCRWASRSEQCRNTTQTRLITAFGKTQPLVDWSLETGLNSDTISGRLLKGWPVEMALTHPLTGGKRPKVLPPLNSES